MSARDFSWSKVDRRGPDECWPWTASTNRKGYGCAQHGERRSNAHRVAFILTHGPIPNGICVLHRCDNPPCCNPAHLFLGTVAENNADMARKGRAPMRGTRHWKNKLTEDDVRAIRSDPRRGKDVAAAFGVGQALVSEIRSRKVWCHVD